MIISWLLSPPRNITEAEKEKIESVIYDGFNQFFKATDDLLYDVDGLTVNISELPSINNFNPNSLEAAGEVDTEDLAQRKLLVALLYVQHKAKVLLNKEIIALCDIDGEKISINKEEDVSSFAEKIGSKEFKKTLEDLGVLPRFIDLSELNSESLYF